MTVTETTTAPAGRPSSGYMPALDGSRALAILLVIVSHITPGFLWGGGLGVDMFFVLSGYLITGILLKERARTGTIHLKRFYLRRFARLYPELLIVVAVMGAAFLIVINNRLNFLIETIGALTYTTVLPFEMGWGGSRVWTHTWTLSIEELFYLIWPLLLILGLRNAWIREHAAKLAIGLGLGLLIVAFVLAITVNPYPSVFFRMGAMAIGGGCALLTNHGWFRQAWVGWVGLIIFLVSVIAASLPEYFAIGVTFLPAAIGSTMLVVHLATTRGGALNAAFSWRPVAYIGVISYGWYLWHFPMLVLSGILLPGNDWMHAAAWVPASFLAAAATQRLLAKPIQRLKDRASQIR